MSNTNCPVNAGRSYRIVMYSHDGFGLGHLRRNVNIATRFVKEYPDAGVLLLAGLPGIPGLDLPKGVDLVKLPSLRKIGTENWESRSLPIGQRRLAAMRREIVTSSIKVFDPDVLLVDYMPGGVWGELAPAIRRLSSRARPTKIVLGLRDILDASEVTRRAWHNSVSADLLKRHYNQVLIYGQAEIFDTAEFYGLNEMAPGQIEYVGYICDKDHVLSKSAVRERLWLADRDQLVLVTAGGGADAFPFMSLVLDTISQVKEELPVAVVMVTGPLMDPGDVETLRARCTDQRVTVRRTAADLHEIMAAADLVLTMGSYNTLIEAVSLEVPVISIPRAGPSAEQRLRAECFAALGYVDHVEITAGIEALAAAIRHRLGRPHVSCGRLRFDGLDAAVAALSATVPVPHQSVAIR